ncbi:ATPase [Bradyrhizobium sp. INPA01-394B]|uniref:SRPBCC domain-containing protein n=1 Tax=Bradyrhizobium campsiandrae TaxID=1729892 RepID=A0ABR7UJP0_9BRAD|nr:SRPBCC domain-containing protein [Bradyrhizobium campsiandrae]MBC9883506.1 ATPase [Bradyrhizobium campsiandrae]MBC9983901.1 SRPBCC domain-containing protein [Bradyrhizobium campsiandrae]
MNDADRTHTSSRFICANTACIYDACIESEKLVRWIAPAGAQAKVEEFDAREGGRFKIILSFSNDIGKSSSRTDVVSGRFLRLVPGEGIVQAIEFVSDRPEFAGTMIMSWRLHPSGDRTLVSVVAENVPQGIGKADHESGMASSLENLARFVETVCDR